MNFWIWKICIHLYIYLEIQIFSFICVIKRKKRKERIRMLSSSLKRGVQSRWSTRANRKKRKEEKELVLCLVCIREFGSCNTKLIFDYILTFYTFYQSLYLFILFRVFFCRVFRVPKKGRIVTSIHRWYNNSELLCSAIKSVYSMIRAYMSRGPEARGFLILLYSPLVYPSKVYSHVTHTYIYVYEIKIRPVPLRSS